MSKRKLRDKIGNEFAIFVSVVCLTAVFATCWYNFYFRRMIAPYFKIGNWFLIFLFAVFYRLLAEVFQTFKISVKRVFELAYSQVLALAITNVVVAPLV